MVQMGMRKEEIEIDGVFQGQRIAQMARSRAAVYHNKPVSRAQFKAGGFAAIPQRSFSRCGSGAPCAPDFDGKVLHEVRLSSIPLLCFRFRKAARRAFQPSGQKAHNFKGDFWKLLQHLKELVLGDAQDAHAAVGC